MKRRASPAFDYSPRDRLSLDESHTQTWSIAPPTSLARRISPPDRRRPRFVSSNNETTVGSTAVSSSETEPTLAAVEAGEAFISDHLDYFSSHLSKAVRSRPSPEAPRISIEEYRILYERNQHPHGHHFVINQHDHPQAGVHYDLRLQFSQSSSISFAVPYGLPGNPNSKRLLRMAIETRVHNMWVGTPLSRLSPSLKGLSIP